MTNVLVSGLPDSTKLPKLIFIFKGIMKQAKVYKFWIKDLSDLRGTDLKAATVEFYDHKDAVKALNVLDGYAFQVGPETFLLRAEVLNPPDWQAAQSPPRDRERQEYRPRQERSRRERYERLPRERSRSPVYRDEASKLDMEIELLRKQRMIIEEERRLILERKKLELIQEFGPSAVKDFDRFEDREYERPRRFERKRSPPPRRPVRERVGPIPAPKYGQPTNPSKKAMIRAQRYQDRLPSFYLPCKLILDEMKEVIVANTTESQRVHLYQIIRTTLRKRLAICLGDEPRRLAAKAVVDLYRTKHPAVTDVGLVKKLLNDIIVSNLVECDEGSVSGEKEMKEMGKGTTNESSNTGTKTAVTEENATNEVNEQVDSVTEVPNTDCGVKDVKEEIETKAKEEIETKAKEENAANDITMKTGSVAEKTPNDGSFKENGESKVNESEPKISNEGKLNQETDTASKDMTVLEGITVGQLSAEVAFNLGEDSADWTEVDVDGWTSIE